MQGAIDAFKGAVKAHDWGQAAKSAAPAFFVSIHVRPWAGLRLREIEMQALKISNQLVERKELTGKDGAPLISELTDDERAARIASLLDVARARRDGPTAGQAEAESMA
jgi:hypothetical protein